MTTSARGQEGYISHHFSDERFHLVHGDMLDIESLKTAIAGHDFVFHFAANPDIAKSMVETDLDLKQTVIATYNLLEAMRVHDVRRNCLFIGKRDIWRCRID